MRELINFTLNSPQGEGEHTVVFKQPLLIKPNSTITVNSASDRDWETELTVIVEFGLISKG